MLGLSAVNPFLLFGSILIASPIIIHLLSKRRYRIIDWAAMDFLLEADRRNRRRVRLEHLILLLLRCLAILLVALLVSRLFVKPTGLAASLAVEQPEFERIVVLDDSPSMQARRGNGSSFEVGKRQVLGLLEVLAEEHPGDTLTLLLTSRPQRPLKEGAPINQVLIDELRHRFEQGDGGSGLREADLTANYAKAISEVESSLVEATSGELNRAVYLISDFRAREWSRDGGRSSEDLQASIQRLLDRESIHDVFIVDVGGTDVNNLAVVDVRTSEKSIVQHRATRFEVIVRNFSGEERRDVPMNVSFGGARVATVIDVVQPGEEVAVPVTVTFTEAGPQPMTVEIEGGDQMPADDIFRYAANVQQGIRILVVDGHSFDQLPGQERFSESHFLRRALHPRGPFKSGNQVEVVTLEEFAIMDRGDLDRFQVLFLLNVGELYGGDANNRDREQLENWVAAGGGLIVFLGDRVRSEYYNEALFRNGEGLLPLRLDEEVGDPSGEAFVRFAGQDLSHPVMRIVREGNSPGFEELIRTWQYWQCSPPVGETAKKNVSVLAVFSNPDASPAIAEKTFGNGRVMMITTSADDLWTNWSAYPDYVVMMQEMSYFVARKDIARGNIQAGRGIRLTVDLADYQPETILELPDGDTVERDVKVDRETAKGSISFGRIGATDDGAGDDTQDAVSRCGFYKLKLTRRSGQVETRLYAANIDPTESNLGRAKVDDFENRFPEKKPVFLEALAGGANLESGKSEFGIWLLYAVILVLGLELFLGWSFGRRR